MAKKGYNYPIKKKIPLTLLLNLFGTFIITQKIQFVNRFYKKRRLFATWLQVFLLVFIIVLFLVVVKATDANEGIYGE